MTSGMSDYDDEWDWDGCDHEDYDIDIIDGRARCRKCGDSWYATDEEVLSTIDAMSAHDRYMEEENRKQWWRDLWWRVTAPFRWRRRRRPVTVADDEIPF